jgi:hypothetical protein
MPLAVIAIDVAEADLRVPACGEGLYAINDNNVVFPAPLRPMSPARSALKLRLMPDDSVRPSGVERLTSDRVIDAGRGTSFPLEERTKSKVLKNPVRRPFQVLRCVDVLMPSVSAILTRSATDRASIFFIMIPR